MKKILAIILASLMLLTAAACDSNEETSTEAETNKQVESTEKQTEEITTEEITTEAVVELPYNNAAELLNLVWGALSEDYKFMAMGGDYDHIVNGEAGKFYLDGANASGNINAMLKYPTADFDKLQDAASLIHGMLANNFTCGAYQFADAAAAASMIEALKAEVMNAEWMCGFPEKLSIITAPGNYVVVMFGLGEYCVDPITAQFTTTIAGSEIVVSEVLATPEW